MINRKVRFQGWKIYEGWKWKYGGEGRIIAESKTFYKVKTGLFTSEWVPKIKCEEIHDL